MSDNSILSSRFEHTGEAVLDLNETQREVVETVNEKIDRGEYSFENVRCPICVNQTARDTIAKQDRYGLYHPVAVCRNCGLLQVTPRMDQQSYTEFYRKEYRLLYDGDSNWEQAQFNSQYDRARAVDDYLHSYIDGPQSENVVLDVGAGPGGMAAYFTEQGHPVRACDLDASAVEFGRSQGVRMQQTSIKNLDLDIMPDVVLLSHIVEHFLQPVEQLELLREYGHPETVYFIEVPGVKSIRSDASYYDGEFRKHLQNAHTYYFTIRTLNHLLSKAGFETINIEHGPALERNDEFGHIRACCTVVDGGSAPESFASDYEDIMEQLKDLEADFRTE
jgi:2-polyprenyl-3-methyl-5-hydroxy-6-metoxy-1,4-benzoquinol methylase